MELIDRLQQVANPSIHKRAVAGVKRLGAFDGASDLVKHDEVGEGSTDVDTYALHDALP